MRTTHDKREKQKMLGSKKRIEGIRRGEQSTVDNEARCLGVKDDNTWEKCGRAVKKDSTKISLIDQRLQLLEGPNEEYPLKRALHFLCSVF